MQMCICLEWKFAFQAQIRARRWATPRCRRLPGSPRSPLTLLWRQRLPRWLRQQRALQPLQGAVPFGGARLVSAGVAALQTQAWLRYKHCRGRGLGDAKGHK